MNMDMLNPLIITGMIIVTGALILYSIAIYYERKFQTAALKVLSFYSSGVVLDITSTTFMILGSRHIPITPHGLLGYSALIVMIIDVCLIWRHNRKNGVKIKLSKFLHIYSLIAYSWWILAFIAGGLLVMIGG